MKPHISKSSRAAAQKAKSRRSVVKRSRPKVERAPVPIAAATAADQKRQALRQTCPHDGGGVGHDQLKRFYEYHFIGSNPPDMLPGIAPTGQVVEIPLVAIVQFRDGKVAHEHIYWDQA
jgi:hypothetical protein